MRTQHTYGNAWLGFLVRILPAGRGTRRKVSDALGPDLVGGPGLFALEYVEGIILERDKALREVENLKRVAIRDAQQIYDLNMQLESAEWANDQNRRSKRDLFAPTPAPLSGEATAIPLTVERASSFVIVPLNQAPFAKVSPEQDSEKVGPKVNTLIA
jgi:hypothetical protein